MIEVLRILQHLPDTARLGRGMRIGIRQEEGPPVVGVVQSVSHRRGTVVVEVEGTEKNLTAPAKDATFIF